MKRPLWSGLIEFPLGLAPTFEFMAGLVVVRKSCLRGFVASAACSVRWGGVNWNCNTSQSASDDRSQQNFLPHHYVSPFFLLSIAFQRYSHFIFAHFFLVALQLQVLSAEQSA